jgi:uncharacterized repeat protein (TIGR03803 family)
MKTKLQTCPGENPDRRVHAPASATRLRPRSGAGRHRGWSAGGMAAIASGAGRVRPAGGGMIRFLAGISFIATIAMNMNVASAQTGHFSVVYSFEGGLSGASPSGGVVFDEAGWMFGNTYSGGQGCRTQGCGTVYRIDSDGRHRTLAILDGAKDGTSPFGGMALRDHVLYGGTTFGGPGGQGVIFSVRDNSTNFKVLHRFNGPDGGGPDNSPLVEADGSLYITSDEGGDGDPGHGVLAEITPGGVYEVQHRFTGRADGANPDQIIADAAGHIFGSTREGHGMCSVKIPPTTYSEGCGTVFEFDPSTSQFTTIASFKGDRHGFEPHIGSVDSAGNIYGVTTFGGDAGGYGTIFKLRKSATG